MVRMSSCLHFDAISECKQETVVPVGAVLYPSVWATICSFFSIFCCVLQRADRALALEMACLLHHLSAITHPSDVKVDGEKRSLFTGLLTSSQVRSPSQPSTDGGKEGTFTTPCSLLSNSGLVHTLLKSELQPANLRCYTSQYKCVIKEIGGSRD